MAKFKKIGAGWNNDKGNINIVIEEDINIVIEEDIAAGTKAFLLKNQHKEKEKQPDWILKIMEEYDDENEAPF